MDHVYAPLAIPELAAMIAWALSKRDIAQLCQVNKVFKSIYHPLLWRRFSFKSDEFEGRQAQVSKIKGAMTRNLHLIQSVDLVCEDFDILLNFLPVSMKEDPGLDLQLQQKPQQRQQEITCTNLRHLSFTGSEKSHPERLLFTGATCLSSILHLNLRLTHLYLRSNIVFYVEPKELLNVLLSLDQLRQLTIEAKTLYRMFPMIIDLTFKLLKHHRGLEELDLGECQSGGGISSPFQKEKVTEVTKNIGLLTRAEEDILSELEKSLHTSSLNCTRPTGFPRLKRLSIPPRWHWNDYPLSFLESLLGACPNLSSFTVPNVNFSQASVLGAILRVKCPHLTSIGLPKKVIDAGFAHLTYDKVEALIRHLPTLTSLRLEKVLDLSMKDLHEILMAGQSLKEFKILEADFGFDIDETRFQNEEWACKRLEKLCIYDLRRPTSWFWQQLSRLRELRVLEIGNSRASGTAQFDELMLEEQAQAQQQYPGGKLQLLGGLKKLRALRVVSPRRAMWQYPGQAEIEFMEASWPLFQEFSYYIEGYQGNTRPLDQDRPWQRFKETRPTLRVLGSRPELTS